jgi:KDO2-lipid IV(A) lauroyltransferase
LIQKKNFMLDYLLYISVRILSFVICRFPIEYSLFWARIYGTIFYYLLPKRAKICSLNLKLALGETISFVERKKTTQEVFKNLAMNFAELLYFPRIDNDYIKKYIKIIGEKKINPILNRKKGLIFFTAHFGNWELSSLAGQAHGYPMVVLAREQKFPRLNSLLNSYRQRLGSRVISRGSLMRELLSSLRSNEVVGILGDQKAGSTGILVEFFGRLAWTPTGAVTLARHTGAGILPVFMIRERAPYHRIEIQDELSINNDDNQPLEKFARLLEGYIRKYPSQWLWFHRRWKASPNKNILILSDGKAGHLSQVRTVAGIVKNLIKEMVSGKRLAVSGERLAVSGERLAVSGELVKVKEIEVKFRNNFTKRLINLFGLFCAKKCTGCLRCIRLSLKKDTFNEVSHFFADMVISCGSSLACLNLILAKENQAKSIIVMKPGLIPVKKFDLAIIPAHDRVKPRKNVVITEAALNLIDEQAMREGINKLQATGYPGLPIKNTARAGKLQAGKTKIGVLIGGESKNYTLTKGIVNTVIDELLTVAKDLDAQLLVTTSRRTSLEVDSLIKKRLLGNPLCHFLIIANEKNIGGAVAGILGLSDIVVVSRESISMISEALSSTKPVVVFEIERRGGINDTKHKRFLDNLVSQNYLSLVKPQELSKRIKRIYQEPPIINPLRDKELISEAIRKLF